MRTPEVYLPGDAAVPPDADRVELQGRFAGFFRDVFGKRRLVIQVGKVEQYLKVPKPLRGALDGVLVAGQEVTVTCHRAPEGRAALTVSQVRIVGSTACISCPILVCTKKSCWRNGGRELWATLEREAAQAGLSETVRIKSVDCLGECKRGPNVEFGGRAYHRCTPREATEILRQYRA